MKFDIVERGVKHWIVLSWRNELRRGKAIPKRLLCVDGLACSAPCQATLGCSMLQNPIPKALLDEVIPTKIAERYEISDPQDGWEFDPVDTSIKLMS
jgi:hypothetical protein